MKTENTKCNKALKDCQGEIHRLLIFSIKADDGSKSRIRNMYRKLETRKLRIQNQSKNHCSL
jgi:hypothetical protein